MLIRAMDWLSEITWIWLRLTTFGDTDADTGDAEQVDAECKRKGSEWCQYNLSASDVQAWHAAQRSLIKTIDHGRHMVGMLCVWTACL
jgi:hypothetical protein